MLLVYVLKLLYYSLAFVAGLKRATDDGSLPEIAQYSPYYLPLNICIAFKGSNLYSPRGPKNLLNVMNHCRS